MSKIYKIIPSNRKTLFLRNLESELLCNEWMNKKDIPNFRKYLALNILELLEGYSFDCEYDSDENMRSRYIDSCLDYRKV
jgi:hypothetical protein